MRILLVFAALLAPGYALAKGSGGGGSSHHIMIPVRVGVLGGYQSSQNSFDADHKNFPFAGLSVGGDFNVPIPPIKAMVGVTGWLGFPKSSDTRANTFMLIAPYLGYSDGITDVFLGVGGSAMSHQITGVEAAPDKKIDLNISMGCGVLGLRHNWGEMVKLGIGVTGFYCKASSYNKDITDLTGVKTTTRINSPASAAGGMVHLILSWGESRMLH